MVSGGQWRIVVVSGDHWWSLVVSGDQWRIVEDSGGPWDMMKIKHKDSQTVCTWYYLIVILHL